MPITLNPEWQSLALYALGAALILLLLFNLPVIGRLFRALFSLAFLAFCLFLLFQHAPFDPNLARFSQQLGLDNQVVTGEEVQIRMSPDGHFWARATINGVERRMLVDSGATVTALSEATAAEAAVTREANILPIMLQTAGGTVQAETGSVERLVLGGIEARSLKVVIAPTLRGIDVLGMNFLSQLASWRVEDNVLYLRPEPGEPENTSA